VVGAGAEGVPVAPGLTVAVTVVSSSVPVAVAVVFVALGVWVGVGPVALAAGDGVAERLAEARRVAVAVGPVTAIPAAVGGTGRRGAVGDGLLFGAGLARTGVTIKPATRGSSVSVGLGVACGPGPSVAVGLTKGDTMVSSPNPRARPTRIGPRIATSSTAMIASRR
jgi:hypothetical protein